MDLTDALRGEHGVFYALFDHIEARIEAAATADELRGLGAAVAAALVPHAELEDELLFSALEPHLGPIGPLEVMRHEHHEIERDLGRVSETTDDTALSRLLSGVIHAARAHFEKEERVLFPMSHMHLDAGKLRQLADAWAARRGVKLVRTP